MKKQKIAFDFDKVFVDYPPFIPTTIIDALYKKKNGHLSYRIPGTFEQKIRILSHHNLLRSPIKPNIAALSKITDNDDVEAYVISSRFSFLEKKTEDWTKKNKMSRYFKKMYFNYKDEQPHIFKERILRSEEIDKFIDDDLDLLLYLAERNPNIKFYWINKNMPHKKLLSNIIRIRDLEEFLNKYLQV